MIRTTSSTPNGDATAVGAAALFDQAWKDFDETYSYFTYKDIDWDALKTQFRPGFETDLSADEFADKLAEMLRELHDFHVIVQKPDETYAEVYARTIDENYPHTPRNRYTQSGGYQTLGGNVIYHTWFLDNLAYIRIDTFETAAFDSISDDNIESLFAFYADAAGMIVDIRPNSGGNENIAAKFASRFTER